MLVAVPDLIGLRVSLMMLTEILSSSLQGAFRSVHCGIFLFQLHEGAHYLPSHPSPKTITCNWEVRFWSMLEVKNLHTSVNVGCPHGLSICWEFLRHGFWLDVLLHWNSVEWEELLAKLTGLEESSGRKALELVGPRTESLHSVLGCLLAVQGKWCNDGFRSIRCLCCGRRYSFAQEAA